MKRGIAFFSGLVALSALSGCKPTIVTILAEPARARIEAGRAQLDLKAMRGDSISVEEWHHLNQCELGERLACYPGGLGLPGGHGGPWRACIAWPDGTQHWSNTGCATPLVIAWDDAPVVFTNAPAPFAIGPSQATEWVSADSPWIATRDCKLFEGFPTLAKHDDNTDGVIDDKDAIYNNLVLWSDRNQDKQCDADELTSLQASGIESVSLTYVDHVPTTDGSYEGETSQVTSARRARAVDVHVAALGL